MIRLPVELLSPSAVLHSIVARTLAAAVAQQTKRPKADISKPRYFPPMTGTSAPSACGVPSEGFAECRLCLPQHCIQAIELAAEGDRS